MYRENAKLYRASYSSSTAASAMSENSGEEFVKGR